MYRAPMLGERWAGAGRFGRLGQWEAIIPVVASVAGKLLDDEGGGGGGGSYGYGAGMMPGMTQTQTAIQETRVMPIQTTSVNVQVAEGDISGSPGPTPPFPMVLPVDPNLPGVASYAAASLWPRYPSPYPYPAGTPMVSPYGPYPTPLPGAAMSPPSEPFIKAGLPDVGDTAIKVGGMKIPWWAVILGGAGLAWWLFFAEPGDRPMVTSPRPAPRRVTLREVGPRRRLRALTA